MANETKQDGYSQALARIEQAKQEGKTELVLSSLGLTELPNSLWQLSQLQVLNLTYNQLTSVPETLTQLSQLQTLNLSFNQLTSVPQTLGQLSQLQTLDLRANQLTSVPQTLGQLYQLRWLDLANNQLTSVPKSLGRLVQLQALFLSANQLMRLPESLGQLSQLQILVLSNNQLTRVPESLGRLSRLWLVLLTNNQLTSIPESLAQLGQLDTMDLSSNQLISVPQTLRDCESLKQLYLHANAKLNLPDDVLGPTFEDVTLKNSEPANPKSILDYYIRTRGGKKPLNEAKLILVGRGAVGKTSLVNRLVYNQFSKREKQTEGIKITDWQVALKSKEKVKLNIWDFGGQEIMHATHQFFLTQRSLYLLVLNGREGGEDADAEYWLKLIEAFGGSSPVIVVMNKIKEHPFDLNRSALQQKYPSIKDFVKTDCETVTGVKELRKIIERETDRLENLRASFPAAWFEIKKRLPEMKKDFLSFEEFRSFCEKHGEKDEKAQDQLAGFLHDLGIALNYRDDPRLNDTHVLNPHWVTTGIYKILNSKKLELQKGEIRLQDLSKVLDSKTYPPRMRGFLLDLMRRFDLCFTFPDKDDCYLIPELLPKQEPKQALEFKPQQCLNFQYHYPVLPEGLLPRFIVRTHVLSEKLPRWRTGVILQFEGCRALVKADPQEKKVFISVSGDGVERRRLMALIRSEFERIHGDVKNLNPLEMVPFPNHPTVLIPHKELLVMANQGIRITQRVVGNEVVDIDISELVTAVDLTDALMTRVRLKKHSSGEPLLSRQLIRVFISYSHKDERFREQLEVHLKLLQRNGRIEIWHDRKITAGKEWKDKIDENLERADIVLLLISADFIASDYCYDVEMKRALERHKNGEARVIPVIVRDVNWKKADFAGLQGLPKDGKAVKSWNDRDKAWRNVSEGIERAVEELCKRSEREVEEAR